MVEAKSRNSWARWTSSEMVNVESMVTPWTTEPMKALRVSGLYCFSAWLIRAFRKAFWRWMRPKSLVPSYIHSPSS